ncbi:hypothetical protein [Thermococcus alcaliphilus]|uniref:hypothetical protein n=1 Tax=Thermococcus alcaliphilus TaxID=139207 RepID=UPI002091D396|nr:hypothetical protein [Thermococcus alcaliphilus]MCO6041154.1 hypothetical protein [Thermococcus alcaliphilus]
MKHDSIIDLPLITREDINSKLQEMSNTLDFIKTLRPSTFRSIGAIVSFFAFLTSFGLFSDSLKSLLGETAYFMLIFAFFFVPLMFFYYLVKIDSTLLKWPELFGLYPTPKKDPVYSKYRSYLIAENLATFILATLILVFLLFILLMFAANIKLAPELETVENYLSKETYDAFIILVKWILMFLSIPLLWYFGSKINEILSSKVEKLKLKRPWRRSSIFFYGIVISVAYWILFIILLVYTQNLSYDKIQDIFTNLFKITIDLLKIPAFYVSFITLMWIFGEILSQLSRMLVESRLLNMYATLHYLANMIENKEPTDPAEFMVRYYESVEKYSKVSVMNIFLFFPILVYVPSMDYLMYLKKMRLLPSITDDIKAIIKKKIKKNRS